ncbi:MAG: polysaccharide biosynthesis tyrosine autokinase [Planctomycetes bacterium]|nr:polysaccharide biosynthesis tyrosine autokinase [Planctomycetota bacterium]
MAYLENNQQFDPQNQIIQYDGNVQGQPGSAADFFVPVLRRWPIICAAALIISIFAIPSVWLLMRRSYETEGAVRVTPIVSRILFSDPDTDRPLPNYENFMNTQAALITSNKVLNRVADELKNKDIEYFKNKSDLAIALKLAINFGKIKIEPARHTELIRIQMTGSAPRDAEIVIDAFLRAYMAIVVADELRGGDQKLSILEEKRRLTTEQISRQRDRVRTLAEEYGTISLDGRQDMMLQQVINLQNELTNVEVKRLSLETAVKMKENVVAGPMDPIQLMQMKSTFVNSDPTIQIIITGIAEQESLFARRKQMLVPGNPELEHNAEIIDTLKASRKDRESALLEKFNQEFEIAMQENNKRHIADIKLELESTKEYEKRIRDELTRKNTETIGMGRKQLTINDQQEKLLRLKTMHDTINSRIDELEMESKRPARITVAYSASSIPATSKKVKLTFIILFLSVAIGCFVAFILEKLDTSLRSPDDVIKNVGVRIIGTTTSPKSIDRLCLPQQLTDDYQTIRANLDLISESSAKIIVVSSPGSGDGKTTFAVNLATSFAQSGKKTLLIDGDLRKPDIARTLNLPRHLRGLQNLLAGTDPKKAIHRVALSGLHVLTADRSNTSDALDVLGQAKTVEMIKDIAKEYDRVIVDTSPVLAFTDALLWARLADGVILTSIVDHTSRSELKETIARLQQVGAKVIGTVVHNVQTAQSYNPYGYAYGYGADDRDENKPGRADHLLLITDETEEE